MEKKLKKSRKSKKSKKVDVKADVRLYLSHDVIWMLLDDELRTAASTIKCLRSMIKSVRSDGDVNSDPAKLLDKVYRTLEAKYRELWAVTFVEYGDSVDGKARVMGLYNSKEEAHLRMKEDAEGYMKDLGLEVKVYDDSASVGDTDEVGCEYRIEKVKIPEVNEEVG